MKIPERLLAAISATVEKVHRQATARDADLLRQVLVLQQRVDALDEPRRIARSFEGLWQPKQYRRAALVAHGAAHFVSVEDVSAEDVPGQSWRWLRLGRPE